MLACICAGIAFEQAAAAHREQGVADEDRPLARQMVGDVAGGVGGDLDHLGLDAAERDAVAFGDGAVHASGCAPPRPAARSPCSRWPP